MNKFSQRLRIQLISSQPKTLQQLTESFSEKSFAILFLLLLAVPALPLPTGGVTHVFEIIAMFLAIELIAGRKTVWLPKRWLDKSLPTSLQKSALPRFITIVQWFEKYSRPRFTALQTNNSYNRAVGLIILVFTLFAFLAPPLSGLDTLPSFGVVLLSLALIFEDTLLAVCGMLVGSIGVGLIIFLGRLAFKVL